RPQSARTYLCRPVHETGTGTGVRAGRPAGRLRLRAGGARLEEILRRVSESMAPGNPQATPGAGRRPGEVDADAKSLSRVSPPGHFSAGTPRSIPVAPTHRPAAARPRARPGQDRKSTRLN